MMKGIFAAGLLVFGGAVQAATVDLTDGAFSAVAARCTVNRLGDARSPHLASPHVRLALLRIARS